MSITEERARELKLYNFIRPQEERRANYALLRSIGAPSSHARKFRDYSDYHFNLMVSHYLLSEQTAPLP